MVKYKENNVADYKMKQLNEGTVAASFCESRPGKSSARAVYVMHVGEERIATWLSIRDITGNEKHRYERETSHHHQSTNFLFALAIFVSKHLGMLRAWR